MAHKSDIEGPVDKHLFKPDGAEKMPTKTYPSSSKIGRGAEHKKGIIEGPGEDCKKY